MLTCSSENSIRWTSPEAEARTRVSRKYHRPTSQEGLPIGGGKCAEKRPHTESTEHRE
jgi:hypothetical protein